MQPDLINAATQSITPFMQYGFAGFAFVQFAAFVWIAYKAVMVIAENTQVIKQLNDRDMEQARKIDEIRDCVIRLDLVKERS
jgi:hypothetical protein